VPHIYITDISLDNIDKEKLQKEINRRWRNNDNTARHFLTSSLRITL